mmetsp:Transcript_48121/g.98007  ORF Transcript_48121/g.98007 Transcript_48121/m.98007 type:complete len:101 (-) Transcript_48121:91-393(-)
MTLNGPNLLVPAASRPDVSFEAVDDPPIEIIIKAISERSQNPPCEAPEAPEASPDKPVEATKVEVKPSPNRESKIKRKATGFVKDPPDDDEGRRGCCVLM